MTDPDTSSPTSNPAAAPAPSIAPTHFPHRTTTAAPVNAMIDTATPALNTVPVELDSTPVASPVVGAGEAAGSGQVRKGSLGGVLASSSSGSASASGSGAGSGPGTLKERVQGAMAGAEAKIKEALSSSSGSKSNPAATAEIRKVDDRGILAGAGPAGKLRADSAAVMAGPPGTPGPEDFEAARVDSAVTPS